MNEFELVAAAILLDRTAGTVVEAAGSAVLARMRARIENLRGRVAGRIDGSDLDDRLAMKVLQEAAATDDDVALAYLAGLLLASDARVWADEGVFMIGVVSQMSSLQIRVHFAIYSALHKLLSSQPPVNLNAQDDCERVMLVFDEEDLFTVVGGVASLEPSSAGDRCFAAFAGLRTLNLVGSGFYGDASVFVDKTHGVRPASDRGVVAAPTTLGAQLFLWGTGSTSVEANSLANHPYDHTSLVDSPPTELLSAELVVRPSRRAR